MATANMTPEELVTEIEKILFEPTCFVGPTDEDRERAIELVERYTDDVREWS